MEIFKFKHFSALLTTTPIIVQLCRQQHRSFFCAVVHNTEKIKGSISRRIWSHLEKAWHLLIRDQDGVDWWKEKYVIKSRGTVPLRISLEASLLSPPSFPRYKNFVPPILNLNFYFVQQYRYLRFCESISFNNGLKIKYCYFFLTFILKYRT